MSTPNIVDNECFYDKIRLMTEEELKKQAIEAIEITEKVVSSKQKVCVAFAIPALSATFAGILLQNPYLTLIGGVPAFFTTSSYVDTVSDLIKLDEGKSLIASSMYEEFVAKARAGRGIQTLLNIADAIEEEFGQMNPPDEDHFDDTFYI